MEPGDAAWSRAEAAWLTQPDPPECPRCGAGLDDDDACEDACGWTAPHDPREED